MKNVQIINEQVVLDKQFRVYGTKENPLFLAKDVARWLDLTNVTDMISRVDEYEVTKFNLGGLQGECNFLTENGVYEVLMQSRKPIAREFKRQVKQILKTIRLTGSYVSNTDLMISTYFGSVDDSHKVLIKGLLTNIETQQNKIIKLEDTVTEIVTHNLTIETFAEQFNRYIRHIAEVKFNNNYATAYGTFYEFLNYKIKINIKLRRTNAIKKLKQTYIDSGKKIPTDKTLQSKVKLHDVVKPEEYEKVLEIVKSWCVDLGIDITNLEKLQ